MPINLIEMCMQTCFGWMAVNAAFIGRFYSFVSIFPVTICPIQCMRKILGNGKGEVRLRPELKGLVSCSTVLTREMSPARSCVTGGSPACNYSVLKLNALRAAGQQIIIGKGTRVKAIHSQEIWPRLPRSRSLDSHTNLDLSVCEARQVVPVARECELTTRLLMSDQKHVYLFNQAAMVPVFKSSKGSNNGPGGTGNEHSLWAYLNTLFIITKCVFDPQFNNHDWTCIWFYMFMSGKKMPQLADVVEESILRHSSGRVVSEAYSSFLVVLFLHI